MKTLRVLLTLLLLPLCPASLLSQACQAYTSQDWLSTGVDPATNALLPGPLDPAWQLIAEPSSSTVPRNANVFTTPPTTAWTTISGTQWIGAQASGDGLSGDYYYQRCFCLRDGFARPQLQLMMRADNRADVYLNQTLSQIQSSSPPLPILTGTHNNFGSSTAPDTLTLTRGFQNGRNCLIVKVHNEGSPSSFTGLDLAASITAAGPNGTLGGVITADCCGGELRVGRLKVCKVAGLGVAVGTPFQFSAGGSTFTVPAGPAPGGYCALGPSFPVGTTVTVTEAIPSGVVVSSIVVAPPGQVVGTPSLSAGTVQVSIGSGVTEVTYTDQRTGFLEICKQGDVRGSFTFYVNPGNLGPFTVPAGACSPAIEVPAGTVDIHEQPAHNGVLVGCFTIPAGNQGACNLTTQTSTVTVAPGDVSTQTIAVFTNRPRIIDPHVPDENPN